MQTILEITNQKFPLVYKKITTKNLLTYIVQLPLHSMSRDLKICADDIPPGKIKLAMQAIAYDLQNGLPLSDALEKHPKFFHKRFINIVTGGEVYCTLELVLKQLSTFIKHSQKLQKTISEPLVYLMSAFVIFGTILIAIMVFVIPVFKTLFAQMGITLPAATQLLISISDYLLIVWWIAPLLLLEPISYFRILMGNKAIKVKLFGNMIEKFEICCFMHALSVLIKAKLPVYAALMIAKETINDPVVYNSTPEIYYNQTLLEFLKNSGKFKESQIKLIAQSGNVSEALVDLACQCDQEIDRVIKKTFKIIEPAFIILMGIAIGFIVISLFLPLISLVQHMG